VDKNAKRQKQQQNVGGHTHITMDFCYRKEERRVSEENWPHYSLRV
jgi:hypothetical protein